MLRIFLLSFVMVVLPVGLGFASDDRPGAIAASYFMIKAGAGISIFASLFVVSVKRDVYLSTLKNRQLGYVLFAHIALNLLIALLLVLNGLIIAVSPRLRDPILEAILGLRDHIANFPLLGAAGFCGCVTAIGLSCCSMLEWRLLKKASVAEIVGKKRAIIVSNIIYAMIVGIFILNMVSWA